MEKCFPDGTGNEKSMSGLEEVGQCYQLNDQIKQKYSFLYEIITTDIFLIRVPTLFHVHFSRTFQDEN